MATVTPSTPRPEAQPQSRVAPEPDRAVLVAATAAWYDPDGAAWEPEPGSRDIRRPQATRPPIRVALNAEDVRG